MAVSPTTMAAVRASGAVPNAEYLLSAEGVRKEFPGVVALDDVQFRLKRASVHALMGENGAGKSTLMKILAGIYTPDKGDIRLKGIEIRLKSPLDALENGIAMIHQELNLMPFMTVAENIWIRREPKNRLGFIDHGLMHRMTEELFARLNISIDPDIEVRFLSVANRQMVEIAKAVSYNSDVLIMDEPTSALTEREVEHLFRIIRDLRAQGIGIVYITHKMNELFEIADEFSVFRDGRYIGTHASTDVTRDDIIRMMVGREITQMFPKEEVPIGEVVLSVKDLCLKGVFNNVSFEVRAGEILGVAGLVGSGRSNVAETLFGVTPASSGSVELYGKPVTISSPTEAIRNRMAFLTEDRKDTGCLLILDILENMQIAVLQDRYVKGGFVQQGAIETTCEDMAKAARENAQSLRAGGKSFGRQSAEGADRALAAHGSAHPHPRRADARHRCRRQGGNPPAGHGDGAKWRGGGDDLVRDARGSRHERPHHGHARGTCDRFPQSRRSNADKGDGTGCAVMRRRRFPKGGLT